MYNCKLKKNIILILSLFFYEGHKNAKTKHKPYTAHVRLKYEGNKIGEFDSLIIC